MITDIVNIRSFDDLRLFYFKYKDSPEFSFTGVALVVLIALVVTWKVILPQTHDWFSIQNEITAEKVRISQLKTNQNILNNISSAELKKQYNVASTALPYVKDYTGMIEAIDQATLQSGMQRDDYSLEIGNLSTKSAQLAPETTITVKVSLQGKASELQKFLVAMNKEVPLSEVVTVGYTEGVANVEINFFYKYLKANTKIPYTDPIRTLNQKNLTLLKTLTSWVDAQSSQAVPNFVPSTPATPSGI